MRLALALLRASPALVMLVMLPSLTFAQALVWDLEQSSVDLAVSAELEDQTNNDVLCQDSEDVEPIPVEAGTTYSATAACEGADAMVSAQVASNGLFEFAGLVGAFASFPEISGAIAQLDCSFAFTVSTNTNITIDFRVMSEGSADRALRFALIGPSGTIMESELTPLAWDEIDQDVSLFGPLLTGDVYRLDVSFLFDAWDDNAATVTVDDFRFGGVIPVQTGSWGDLKHHFRTAD